MYQKTLWSHDFINGLETDFSINCKERVKELAVKVAEMIMDYENGDFSTLELLELVDNIQRLGLGCHFQNNITRVLNKIAALDAKRLGLKQDEEGGNLHALSLKFRILRQHGYYFLRKFKEIHGVLIGGLHTDIKALLSIYEASHLALEEELDLHEAKLFATENLLELNGQENQVMKDHVNHALDIPLYRRMLRLEARWYIDAYGLLELDRVFILVCLACTMMTNIEIDKNSSTSWIGGASTRELGDPSIREASGPGLQSGLKLSTARRTTRGSFTSLLVKYMGKRLVAIFPRIVLYDRKRVQQKLALYQGVCPIYMEFSDDAEETFETALSTLKVVGENRPSKELGLHQGPTHGMLLLECWNVESLEKKHDLYKWSSMLFRLYNDLAASLDEKDKDNSPNAISCYMHEHGVSEEVAREHIQTLIDKAWMKMIEARIASSEHLTDPSIDMAINLARVSNCTYQYGDGIKAPEARIKDRVMSVIIEPITISEKERF
ncbi:terpenoid cyclases/protein prenyltransferase alpha-alpha toroid [Artemisia annua]|uniref:Terpenoid cyclases/protein prenyltransferase alpha-alpha toroid n=1 Tax=Artemisia annua TaxID=35608 RepID=A0A2U1M1Q8_ARTAN|nr:terpenoid cyclases/protein prenyltransferase alpha-alpha toroid [Artemisia annua]